MVIVKQRKNNPCTIRKKLAGMILALVEAERNSKIAVEKINKHKRSQGHAALTLFEFYLIRFERA